MAGSKAQVKSLPIATLQAASQQISAVPKELLPAVVPNLLNNLAVCSNLLADIPSPKDAKGSEEVVAMHRFTTQISSLLQDKSPERRWAGVVLVKAALQYGGQNLLQRNSSWIKSLLNILHKPNPSTLHVSTVLTLTRIFLLSHGQPALTRELVTPYLPSFVSACLDITKQDNLNKAGDSSLTWTILESFGHILPLHPTTFRSFQSPIQGLLRPLIAPVSNDSFRETSLNTENVCVSAQCLFVQLYCCAPKAGAAEEWQSLFTKTVESAYDVADLVFRSMVEFWRTDARPKPATNTLQVEVQSDTNPLQLPGWVGIQAGCERLVQLFGLLKCFFGTSNAGPVNCKVGQALNLINRVFLLRVPSIEDEKQNQDNLYNTQVQKEELMGLLRNLPSIHTSAMDLLIIMIDRLGAPLISATIVECLSYIIRLFETEKRDLLLRTVSYGLVRRLLESKGVLLDRSLVTSLSTIMTECCLDCMACAQGRTSKEVSISRSNNTQESLVPREVPNQLQQAASTLLPTLLAKLPPHSVSSELRARMDQAAILSCNRAAIVTSVLNPRSGSSTLPFLTRTSSKSAETEAILRPRLPPITTGPVNLDGAFDDWTGQDDGDEEMSEKDMRVYPSEPDELTTSNSAEEDAANKKRKAEVTASYGTSQLAAQSEIDKEEGSSVSFEQSNTQQPMVDSGNMGFTSESASTTNSNPNLRPPKRVRFSDPEAELLGQSVSLGTTSELKKPSSTSGSMANPVPRAALSTGDATAQDYAGSTREIAGEEDEDDFEVPPLTMEPDTDEEDEG